MGELGEPTKIEAIETPDFLAKRIEVFRLTRPEGESYILRDKRNRRHHDCEPWQWIALEGAPACDSFTQLITMLVSRCGVVVSRKQIEEFFSDLAEDELLSDKALAHPLFAHCSEQTPPQAEFETKTYFFPPRLAAAGPLPAPGVATKPLSLRSQGSAYLRELPETVQDYFTHDPNTVATASWRMFDPRPILNVIVPWLRPLRFGIYLLPFLILAAILTVYNHSVDFVHDMRGLYISVQLVVHMAFSLVTIDLFSQTILACTAHYYGAIVSEISTTIYFGFLPRFRARLNYVEKLPRREQLWVHSSALLSRFFLQCLGIWMWYHARSFSMAQANIGLGLFMICTVDLLFASGNPFAKGSGYKFLTALFSSPNLRGDAFEAAKNLFTGKDSPGFHGQKSKALALYALCVVAYMFILVTFVLEMVYGGLVKAGIGNVSILLTIALGIYLINGQLSRVGKIGSALEHSHVYAQWERRIKPAVPEKAEPANTGRAGIFWRYAVRAAVLAFLILLVLPYPYEPGGNLTVYALRKVEIAPDVSGIIANVYFDGGEWVKKGTVIARLKDDDNLAKVLRYGAEMQAQQEVVENLKTLPRPEAIKVAEADLQTAITQEAFSAEKLARFEKLYKQTAISFDQLDTVRKAHSIDVDQVAQKRAQLALVKAGPTADEIAAAEAKVQSLKELRDDYQDKVNRAVLYMPFDGRITTLHLMQKINTYLDQGQFFADVEDDSQVTAEIDIPETYFVGPIVPGKPIRARADAFRHQEFTGTVTGVDSSLDKDRSVPYVKVVSSLNNTDGRLVAGMVGYAKIEGIHIPVWKAFSMSLLRFFNIEVWSWIP